MTSVQRKVDRSRDLSQPLENLGPDETLKANSDQLRGTIAAGLVEELTAAVPGNDIKLMKFHGLYQQDDRDIRDERRRQKLEPAYTFMARVRLPGGVCSPSQWLKLDDLGRVYAGNTLRLTTRQTFQLHRVHKRNLRAAMQGLRDVLLDTKAACGDDARGVMCSVNPLLSKLHAEVYALAKAASDHAIPKTGAYREIWYGEERAELSGPEEPLYGRTYMPRKFKIGFVIPPSNDIDVYAQDLGFIAIAPNGRLEGFDIAIGGGMGRTDQAPKTYPRLADVIGFVAADKVLGVCDAVMQVQRDYGNRLDRGRARFKYTIDDKGLDWIKAEIEARLGFSLAPARPYEFASNGDPIGWTRGEDGKEHCTLFIENGRVIGTVMDGLRAIARIHKGTFRVTPNQNLIIADIAPEARPDIERVMKEFGLDRLNKGSGLRLNSMACVALPTCGLAMAESERYLPDLVGKIEKILAAHHLEDEPITIRMTGCPNGCARPYIGEIALTGRAPGKYNLYLGGGFHGQRLNKMVLENVGEATILDMLGKTIEQFAKDRLPGERFGDFAIRAGFAAEVKEGRHFND
ncbi:MULTISPECIES: NADPH-dependent assimilatory sulfite reductase hemoprotein subunit [unclassified Mesorhizobium]|uniref:NADPH-dependent assimilatory sulfite reductase hemoprotein subunit n=1 Tax=unclassified Mesorhizobium TaxID=325217 RepID=UPI000FDA00D6|nr:MULTISPECIES: NADPH-dependent assimilatory sulfite reductase hemoprotein subunit [unclassified Mesorhizobium]TGT71948.1 NADPH-dependent assimilatory sulfite reductase hemoprotein subunit [Mesorhizobium sp. M2E.F.Ca.ET.166.01.1.1]TGV99337.1 NADPH-dependent assimilatory sulfite reductase hemoprotein subunit [Mesorhizobium sp. M2E.F.Ca.ET.154.01.1.1]